MMGVPEPSSFRVRSFCTRAFQSIRHANMVELRPTRVTAHGTHTPQHQLWIGTF